MGIALFAGVGGLKAHQSRLDIIAANISNVNTVGYQGSRILFQDLFSQTTRGGSAPSGMYGGSNPLQTGLGVRVGSIDLMTEQGSLQTTGRSSDLAVQGLGYFILEGVDGIAYTRDGSFDLNSQGWLVDPASGMKVQGYVADGEGVVDVNAPLQDVIIPVGTAGIVKQTTSFELSGNLNADAVAGTEVIRTVEVYDSLGATRELTLTFTKVGTPANRWSWEGTYDSPSLGLQIVGTGNLDFQADGTLPATSTGAINITGAMMNESGSQPEDLAITADFSKMYQLSAGVGGTSDISITSQDGFPRGIMQSFTIGLNGEVNGVFSNGLTRTFAQVALATFQNTGGLSRAGNNMFLETPSSGSAQVGPPLTSGRGSVTGGVLESSNIDLGNELSMLLITQRGFQANARTMTAADTLLQESVNLVR